MRLIGATIGVFAALAVLFSWVENPGQEQRLFVSDTTRGLAMQEKNDHPREDGAPVAGAEAQPSSIKDVGTVAGKPPSGREGAGLVAGQGALTEEGTSPPASSRSGLPDSPDPLAAEATEPSGRASGAGMNENGDPDQASLSLPKGPAAAPYAAASDPAIAPATAPNQAPAPTGTPAETDPAALPAPDFAAAVQKEPTPQTDPTLQWHRFMKPFGSAYKAEGFAGYLSRTTGIPMTTIQEGVGEYRVALGYHDAAELRDRITLIEAATGLDVKGGLQ